MFNFSEASQKIKARLLVLSGISLFIGLTEALPQKIAVLGLDLSNSSKTTGWFILAVSLYYFIRFFISSILQIINHLLPHLIRIKTNKTTGEIFGSTASECHEALCANDSCQDEDLGTIHGELNDIENKNQIIEFKYKRNYIKIHNFTVYVMDFAFPIILWCAGCKYLYFFLMQNSHL